jgi:hypothetical protein
MDKEKETVETKDSKLLWILSGLVVSVDVIEFQTREAYTSVDLTRVNTLWTF